MRFPPLEQVFLIPASLVAMLVLPIDAVAQSLRVEDPASHSAAFAARYGALRAGPIERTGHDAIRLTASDASSPAALAIPYRSTSEHDGAPGGFSMRVPGTGLDLTNGSVSIHHTNDGRYTRGVHVSVQLTY